VARPAGTTSRRSARRPGRRILDSDPSQGESRCPESPPCAPSATSASATCVGVSDLRALGTTACARRAQRPKQKTPPGACTSAWRRPCEPLVALVQERAAEQAQAAGRPFQQLSNDRLGGRVPGQGVQVALDDDGGRFLVHGQGPKDQGGYGHFM